MRQFIAFAVLFVAVNAVSRCEVCEKLLAPILDRATPADRAKVVEDLKTLCFGNQACVDKVNSFSGDITSATPESLCTLVGMCTQPTAEKRFLDICSICEAGVDKIKSQVNNETSAQIKSKLELICFGNPACVSKVDGVVDEISTASSQEICTELHLCSSKQLFTYTSGRFCQICERVAEKFLSQLTNETIAQLEQYLDAACHGNARCLNAVQQIVSQLQDATPESVCQAVHLCGSSSPDIRAANKCDACKTKLEDIFSDANLAKVQSRVVAMCHGVQVCVSEVNSVVSTIKNNRDTYVGKACGLARQC